MFPGRGCRGRNSPRRGRDVRVVVLVLLLLLCGEWVVDETDALAC